MGMIGIYPCAQCTCTCVVSVYIGQKCTVDSEDGMLSINYVTIIIILICIEKFKLFYCSC